MTENIIDQISELPECIAHHILSFLDSPDELVRTSVLSKQWFAQTASFPILDFDFHKFRKVARPFTYLWDEDGYARDNFFKYVVYTMSRFCEQNVSAHTFKLKIWSHARIEVEIINRWIGVIFKKGVQVLEFEFPYESPSDYYDSPTNYLLPNTLLLSASSLTSLKLHYCDLPSSLMVDAVKFKCLKLLHLFSVPLSDELIKYLVSCCPLLEIFYVHFCCGFKRFSVLGHQSLRKVRIMNHSEVERIDIEAPNLSTFSLHCSDGNWDPPCMNLGSCKKLTRLHYGPRTSEGFPDISSNFPFLEHLTLQLPKDCNNLKLSSHTLRTFKLNPACDLEKIDMNTPNLVSFVYGAHSSHVSSFPLKLCMTCDTYDPVDSLWFQQLRRFLEKNNGFKELKFRIYEETADDVEELKMIQSQPFELEHVDLEPQYFKNLAEHESVVDAVLWCCRPRSLTLQSNFNIDFEEWSHLVKFTYEKLLEQEEDEGHTNIRIILSSNSNIHFSDLNSLLKSLPCDEIEEEIELIEDKITFIKEQVV